MRAGTPEGEVFLGLIGAAKERKKDAREERIKESEKKHLAEALRRIKKARAWGMP